MPQVDHIDRMVSAFAFWCEAPFDCRNDVARSQILANVFPDVGCFEIEKYSPVELAAFGAWLDNLSHAAFELSYVKI